MSLRFYVSAYSVFVCPRHPRSTLFPYTTLFRSMARERGLAIDREGFDREMQQQRERARASWKGAEKGAVVPAYQKRSEEHTSELQSNSDLVCRLLLEKKKKSTKTTTNRKQNKTQ